MEEKTKNPEDQTQDGIPRLKTDSSIFELPTFNDPAPKTESTFVKYSSDETIIYNQKQKETKSEKKPSISRCSMRLDADMKFILASIILRIVLLIKISIYSMIIFRIQLLSFCIIAEIFGICALTSLKKKMLVVYLIFLGISFISKLIGTIDFQRHHKESQNFDLLLGGLIAAEVIEGIQIIPQLVLTVLIYNMHDSRINLLYSINMKILTCKKSGKEDQNDQHN